MAKQLIDQPMELDGEFGVAASPARDVDGIPYCRKHHCRMKQSSGGKKDGATAYYKCPVDGCTEREQVIKTANPAVVPSKPLACARCSKNGEEVICERDPTASTAQMVILKCPRCQWKSTGLAVPHLAAAMLSRRTPGRLEEIGER